MFNIQEGDTGREEESRLGGSEIAITEKRRVNIIYK